MVLAIGIVVDDAIVVIESVERIMREEHLPPKEATRKAMTQITNPIIAISVVLAAVFIPSALQSGSVGMIYQQFAMTIAISMGFSAFLALSLTPALCAHHPAAGTPQGKPLLQAVQPQLRPHAEVLPALGQVQPAPQALVARGVRWCCSSPAASRSLFVPGSFVPEEDQGFTIGMVMMPPGTSQPRTREFMRKVSEQVRKHDGVHSVFEVTGFSFVGYGEAWACSSSSSRTTAIATPLPRESTSASGIGFTRKDGIGVVRQFPDHSRPGRVRRLRFLARGPRPARDGRRCMAHGCVARQGRQKPEPQRFAAKRVASCAAAKIKVDREQAESMGLASATCIPAAQLMLAPVYVNDFLFEGRVLRVTMQADAPFRMNEESLQRFYLPAGTSRRRPTASHSRATPRRTAWCRCHRCCIPIGPWPALAVPLQRLPGGRASTAVPKRARARARP